MEVLPGNPGDNLDICIAFLNEAADAGAQRVLFPAQCFSDILPGDLGRRAAFRADCLRCGYRLLDAARELEVEVTFGNYTENGDAAVWISHEGGVRVFSLHDPAHVWVVSGRVGYALESRAKSLPRGLEGAVIFGDVARGGEGTLDLDAEELAYPVLRVGRVGIQSQGKRVQGFDGSSWFRMPGQGAQWARPWQQMLLYAGEASWAPESVTAGAPVEISPWAGPWEAFNSRRFQDLGEIVRRFLARAGISRVVVGVSGGVDSSTSAAFFTRLLGPRQVLAVGMPGIYNTRTTQELSRELVENLGCWYAEVPVADSVDWTRKQIQGLGITRPGEQSEIRLSDFDFENVTARDRGGRVLAALASGFGGVFASTGNKAELAVGYCTLYGDLAGFLAPLGDLWKGEIYALAQYLNEVEFCGEIIPRGVFAVHPSAELSSEQNPDRGGGDPLLYWYHDYLLRYWVEQGGSPEEVLRAYLNAQVESLLGLRRKLQGPFKNPEYFVADLERWWGAYQGIAIAKRLQAPPAVDLSGRYFGGGAAECLAPAYYGRSYGELRAKVLGGKKRG